MLDAIVSKFPHLKNDLAQAGMNINAKDFVKKAIISTIFVVIALFIIGFLVFSKLENSLATLFVIVPIIGFFMFGLIINSPKTKIKKKVNEVEREIVYAGRFLLIELSSGLPLFDALVNVSKSFKHIGKYFEEIVNKAEVGKPLDVAINEIMETTPSENFRKLLWQIVNALKTGADISVALNSVVDQISREQIIKINAYNKKLNMYVVLYLLLAIIVPSLGIAMLSLLSTFMGFGLNLGSLIGIGIFVGILQFVFLSMIRNSRSGVIV